MPEPSKKRIFSASRRRPKKRKSAPLRASYPISSFASPASLSKLRRISIGVSAT